MAKAECSRHDCNKKAKQTCQYCGESFCDVHLKAIIPSPAFFDKDDDLYKTDSSAFSSHPCPAYAEQYPQLQENELIKVKEALDKMKRAGKNNKYGKSALRKGGSKNTIVAVIRPGYRIDNEQPGIKDKFMLYYEKFLRLFKK